MISIGRKLDYALTLRETPVAEMKVVGIASQCGDASPVELPSGVSFLPVLQVGLLRYIEGYQGCCDSIDRVLLIAAARLTAWE